MGRHECCVCNKRIFSRKLHFSFCSRNCEKLYLVTQGLVLGNVLQSLFRVISDGKYCYYKTDERPEDTGMTANELSNDRPVAPADNVQLNLCHGDTSELQTSQGNVDSELETRETEDVLYVYPVDDDVASDAENESTADKPPPALVSKTKCNQQKLLYVGDTTRFKSQVHRKLDITRLEKTEKSKVQTRRLRIKPGNTGLKLEDTVSTDTNQHDVPASSHAEDCERESSDQNCLGHSHVQVNNNDKTTKRRVKCKHCGKIMSKSYLLAHYRAVHKDSLLDISVSSLSCSECGKLFMRKQALNAHKLKQHNHKFSNSCGHCGKGFASRFGLSWHMRQVHQVTVRQCGTCGETFENRRDYKKHRRYQHTANSHVCHICGKGFKLKNALQAHLDAHAGVKLHFCEICGDGFVRFSSLCQHKNNLHGPKKSELPFKCYLCPSTFRLQAWLEKHIVQKHQLIGDQVNLDCELCQSYLKTAVHCPMHGGSATETFSCPQCDKVFAKETSLKAHMKQHQEPKFSCDMCQKKFTYKCNMLRHRETHSSEKPFHCAVCAKQFCSKFLLASHMRMHNQDLLFKCKICGKGLTRKDYLKNHLKKMHPEHKQA